MNHETGIRRRWVRLFGVAALLGTVVPGLVAPPTSSAHAKDAPQQGLQRISGLSPFPPG
jgi:hypothetical protein